MSRSGGMMTQRERKEKAAPVLAVDTQAPVAADLHAEVERLRRELDELQRTDRFKDHCLSVAAHELATPLTVIQAYVETLQAKWNAPGFDQVPEFLHVLQHETARLIRTVERTLQISRLTSANQTVQRLPLQLLPLISVVADALRPLFRQHDVRLDVRVPDTLPWISADRDLLEQVFINLLDNAVKFSPSACTVLVRASTSTGWVHVEVLDRGYGIAADEVQHIFDPYFRSRDDRVGHTRGTGLGLALVKTVVEQHGGRIEVESALDRGTVFRLALPQA